MTKKLGLFGLMLAVILFLVPSPYNEAQSRGGQSQSGSRHGAVLVPSGAFVPGADITLAQGRSAQPARSHAHGWYAFREIAPGTYSISVTAAGFARLSVPGVSLAGGESKHLNQTLAIPIAAARRIFIQAAFEFRCRLPCKWSANRAQRGVRRETRVIHARSLIRDTIPT